jgi:hypothetical protein
MKRRAQPGWIQRRKMQQTCFRFTASILRRIKTGRAQCSPIAANALVACGIAVAIVVAIEN